MLVMIFKVNNQFFGIDIKYLHEVIKRQKITPIQDSGTYVAGVTDVRGKIYTCVDINGVLYDKRSNWSKDQLFLLTCCNGSLISFIVDGAEHVVNIDEDSFDFSFKQMSPNSSVEAIFKYDNNLVSLLDVQYLYERLGNT